MGLNGAGKSTLAHALSQATGYFEMDVEDYYFPDQREERQRALEGWAADASGNAPSFSQSKTKCEADAAMLEDIKMHPCFILSCVRMQWNDEITSRIRLVFWVRLSREERLKRIQARSQKRFGARALPGGDLYEQEEAFRMMAASRDEKMVESSLQRLDCPVMVLDGSLPVAENVKKIMAAMEER